MLTVDILIRKRQSMVAKLNMGFMNMFDIYDLIFSLRFRKNKPSLLIKNLVK